MMKSMAAANIRRNELAVEALAVQSSAVELGLRALIRHHPIPAERNRAGVHRVGVVAIGTDQGMCGPFNEKLSRFVCGRLAALRDTSKQYEVLVVGQRLAGLLDEAQVTARDVLNSPISVDGARLLMRELLPDIEDWQASGFTRVVVLHNRPLGGARWEGVEVPLLPLDRRWLERLSAEPWPSRTLPQWSLDDAALFAHLVRQHLVTTLYRAAAESQAAENASRLAAMQAAEQSIGDKLDDLGQTYRH